MNKLIRTFVVGGVLVLATFSFGVLQAKITPAQAQKAALAKYPGKVVGKIELENEEGKWQYAVMIRSGKKLREVMVDAKTGKIANVEVTTAKKEAKEKADEAKAKKGGGH